uniref:C2H2-type domain-containing protein n=1 Tax=Gigaspora margarita TaxID=4874 RepID=A0A8H4EI29_GIGMA
MSDLKCTFCKRTYTNRNRLSKHMNVCILTASKDVQLFVNNPAQIRNYSKPIKQNQNKNFNINKYKPDSEFYAKKISFKDIKFCKSSKVVKDIQFNSNSNLDSTFASPLHVSNTDELASGLDNMSFELDNSNINSNMFEVDPTSNLLDDIETTIDEDQEFFNENLNNSTYFEHIQSSSSDKEIDQKYEEFSNEAYADLIVLKTKVLDLDDTEMVKRLFIKSKIMECGGELLKILCL